MHATPRKKKTKKACIVLAKKDAHVIPIMHVRVHTAQTLSQAAIGRDGDREQLTHVSGDEVRVAIVQKNKSRDDDRREGA